ncbi:MAG: hypothetical protein R3D62_14000 [Xanthobacteraceae bacterium]
MTSFESKLRENPEPASGQAESDAQGTAESLRDEARFTADAVKDQFASTADVVRRHAEEVANAVKEHARAIAEDQKSVGAEQLTRFAQAIDRTAGSLKDELPQAADFARSAAARISAYSDRLRERRVEDLAQDASNVARANTAALFALSLAAGFVASRFLKSSAPPAARREAGRIQPSHPHPASETRT